jgi:hypothetical protein
MSGNATAPRRARIDPFHIGHHLRLVATGKGQREEVEHRDRHVPEPAEHAEHGPGVRERTAPITGLVQDRHDGGNHQDPGDEQQRGRERERTLVFGRGGVHHVAGAVPGRVDRRLHGEQRGEESQRDAGGVAAQAARERSTGHGARGR